MSLSPTPSFYKDASEFISDWSRFSKGQDLQHLEHLYPQDSITLELVDLMLGELRAHRDERVNHWWVNVGSTTGFGITRRFLRELMAEFGRLISASDIPSLILDNEHLRASSRTQVILRHSDGIPSTPFYRSNVIDNYDPLTSEALCLRLPGGMGSTGDRRTVATLEIVRRLAVTPVGVTLGLALLGFYFYHRADPIPHSFDDLRGISGDMNFAARGSHFATLAQEGRLVPAMTEVRNLALEVFRQDYPDFEMPLPDDF